MEPQAQLLFSQLVSLGFKASDPMSVAEQLQWTISSLIFRIPHQVVSFRIKTVHISLLFITCNFFKTWDATRWGGDGGGKGVSRKKSY